MKTALLSSLVVVAAYASPSRSGKLDLLELQVHRARFDEWKTKHGKNFQSAQKEEDSYKAWLVNDQIIRETNAQNLSYKLGHNEYSHLTREQFAARMTMKMPKYMLRSNNDKVDWSLTEAASVPSSIDWVSKGAVTPVKNQAQCGSCWAFSAVGAIEGDLQINTGDLVNLSEQGLVSCDKVDDGCQGGLMDNAFKYVEKHDICTTKSYPYSSGGGVRGRCKKTCSPVATITGYKDVPSKNEDALQKAVAKQPVSVAIEADQSVFQLYKSGVLTSKKCGTDLDHGVLVVGYGTSGGKHYWKVKNSWGESWGQNGYILIERGNNICGISQQPSYPTGAKRLTESVADLF